MDSAAKPTSPPIMFYVYGILNYVNGKIYVGKTNDLKSRWMDHLRTSSNPTKYKNKYSAIHKAINKYSENNFELFIIQEFVNEQHAYESEKYWIEFFQSRNQKYGYNIAAGGLGSGSGINSPNFGRKRTTETIKKLSESHSGIKNHNTGKVFPIETRNNMSIAQRGLQVGEKHGMSKLTWILVRQIRALHKDGLSIAKLAEQFNVHRSNIDAIVKFRTWKE